MAYIYETHLHTSEASACGKTPGKDYISFMKQRGYAGMIVTDHFFNGNSCIPPFLPWKKRIDLYTKGYENAKKAAEGMNFTVLFGVEFNFDGDEYLIYGITPEWLKEHKEIMKMNRKEVHDLIHSASGIMVHAHPYRERDYLHTIFLTPEIADAVEIYNAGNEPYMNALALEYGKKLNVPFTAGSDIHIISKRHMGGISFENRIETINQFVEELMSGHGTPVIVKNESIEKVIDLPEMHDVSKKPVLPVVYESR